VTRARTASSLKIGFGMEYMPCGTFAPNAAFFCIGVLTYNLYLGFRRDGPGKGFERAQVQTVRWRLFNTAGKVVWHARRLVLKVNAEAMERFAAIRERCARLIWEGEKSPETS